MSKQDGHIKWKTDAWKDPGMVAGYHERVSDDFGPNLLKNHVETHIFHRLVTGRDVLDVGVGTGRASLPLAQLGRNVTGVDSSQAMLDKCRENAAGVPVTLVQGDVAALPFADGSFDTVMSLNTFAHFPHWKEIMREWRRAVRDGGQLLFDVYSLDHDVAFARAAGEPDSYGVEHLAPKGVGNYYLRVRVEELAAFADEIGLRISAIVPYGMFFGRAGFNRFFEGSLLQGNAWDRLLSWVRADRKLFDFITFLEEAFVANLTSIASCRFMAVFDAVRDPAANRDWLARNAAYNNALSEGLSPDVLAEHRGVNAAEVRSRLNGHLAHHPNRFALARILLTNRRWNVPLHLGEWLDDAHRRQIEHVLALGLLDDVALRMIYSLDGVEGVGSQLHYRGVSLARALGYDMMSAVLDGGFDAFAHSFTPRERE